MSSPVTPAGAAAALITAAGRSTRMSGGSKKEYRYIKDEPVLRRVYRIFMETGLFSRIVCTCPPGDEALVRELLELREDDEKILIIAGGDTRQKSVFTGLSALETFHPEWVLVHDGSRPWITRNLIIDVFIETQRSGACIPVVFPIDTLITLDEDNNTASYLDRSLIYRVQTPQGFHFPTLFKAHAAASSDGRVYNDDSELFRRYAGTVHTIPGDPENRKITYPGDI